MAGYFRAKDPQGPRELSNDSTLRIKAKKMADRPDHEFDGYLCTSDGQKLLCDIQIWLPREPSVDAALQVIVMGANAHEVFHRGLVTLTSEETVEAAGLRFEAKEVLIRGSTSLAHPRRAGGTNLTFTHVGSWLIETSFRDGGKDEAQSGNSESSIDSLVFILSAIEYALPRHGSIVDYRGNRTIKELRPPKMLSMERASDHILCEWELQRHWHWLKDQRNKASATSFPVLCLRDARERHAETSLEELSRMADDACVILTLAARHRVVVHTVRSSSKTRQVEEWRNPLLRQRAVTEEEASGPLVAESDIEAYFAHVARWWDGLDAPRKDAVRLAIFASNPLTKITLEAEFLSRFSALEGLVKHWGDEKGSLQKRTEAMLQVFPPRIGGLWALFDKTNGEPLYWIRNELAHGRSVMRFAAGALPLANDHLQLWLEHILLALAGYIHHRHRDDWLSNQVIPQRDYALNLAKELRKQAKTTVAE